MEYDLKLYGPPGTGKTTNGIDWLARMVDAGCDPYRLGFVSFTNVACNVARERLAERLDIAPENFEFCRTLHSCAKRALGIGGEDWNQSASSRVRKFGEEYGYDLIPSKRGGEGEDLEDLQATTGQDGPLLAIWDYGRNRLIRDPRAAFEAWRALNYEDAGRIDYYRYLDLVRDWERDKQANGRKDFTDLLLGVADADTWLPVSAVAIDEAQDLSPAQWMVAEKLFAGAERSACFADDDQAIFSFQGAEPGLFNSRVARERVLLEQSYRLPRAVCEIALRVINRNQNRVKKTIRPKPINGEARRVNHLGECDFGNGETWLILIRNWRFLAEIVSWLEAQGFPYRVPSGRHYSPWDEKGPFRAAQSVLELAEGREISLGELAVLVGKTRAETSKTPGAWRYGTKGKLEEHAASDPTGRVGLRELLQLGLTDTGLARILNNDLSLLDGVSVRDRDAYSNALREGRFGQEPKIRATSIHGAKGDEADNVVVLEACSQAPYRNLQDPDRCEEEVRLMYVALTRAKSRVLALRGWSGNPWLIEGWS
jgi:superfamily I DNA/RNA helicase